MRFSQMISRLVWLRGGLHEQANILISIQNDQSRPLNLLGAKKLPNDTNEMLNAVDVQVAQWLSFTKENANRYEGKR